MNTLISLFLIGHVRDLLLLETVASFGRAGVCATNFSCLSDSGQRGLVLCDQIAETFSAHAQIFCFDVTPVVSDVNSYLFSRLFVAPTLPKLPTHLLAPVDLIIVGPRLLFLCLYYGMVPPNL